MAGQDWHGAAGSGKARFGLVRHGMAGEAWYGLVRRVMVGSGMVRYGLSFKEVT